MKELPKRKPINLSKAVQFSVKCRKQNKKITNKRCIPVSEKKEKEGKQHCERIVSIGEENKQNKKFKRIFDQTN